MVTPKSATRGLHGTNSPSIFAINENHSEMVKFREGDPNCHIVLEKLREICNSRRYRAEAGDLFDLPNKILDILKLYFPEYRSNWKALPNCIYSSSEGKRASLIQDLVPLVGHRQGGLHLEAIRDPVLMYFESTTTGPADAGGALARPLVFTSRGSLWSPFTLATDPYKNVLRSTGFSTGSNRITISYNGVQLYREGTIAASRPRFVQRNSNIFELGIKDSSTVSLAYSSENRDRWNRGIMDGAYADALLDPLDSSYPRGGSRPGP